MLEQIEGSIEYIQQVSSRPVLAQNIKMMTKNMLISQLGLVEKGGVLKCSLVLKFFTPGLSGLLYHIKAIIVYVGFANYDLFNNGFFEGVVYLFVCMKNKTCFLCSTFLALGLSMMRFHNLLSLIPIILQLQKRPKQPYIKFNKKRIDYQDTLSAGGIRPKIPTKNVPLLKNQTQLNL